MRRLVVTLVVVAALAAGCGGHKTTSTSTTPKFSERALDYCGRGARPDRWEHVVWIWLENHSYGEVLGPRGSSGDRAMPFLNSLGRSCGIANEYYSLVHPSLPNYISAVSGATHGIASDCDPSACPVTAPSIFDQLALAGRSWRVYAEGMGEPCRAGGSGLYVPAHNPPLYFPRVAEACKRWDVPLREQSAHDLAPLTIFVPNLCNDAHDCSSSVADAWLERWVPKLTRTSAYRASKTVIFVTWDEGSGGDAGDVCKKFDGTCHIATVVVSPSTRRGTFSRAFFDHYSLLKTAEQLLGLPFLGHAAERSTASMRAAFGL